MIFEKKGNKLEQVDLDNKSWNLKEMDLEKLIIKSAEKNIFNINIFGEQLLFLDSQTKTNAKKRVDILALDRNGSAVIIELKKDKGKLGVETQALQYLADFSNYKGEDFYDKFCKNINKDLIEDFLYDDIEFENLNVNSRMILVAQDFDPTLFSLGKWLSENNTSFRCVSYSPIKIENKEFISFNIVFDQLANQFKYRIAFSSKRRKQKIFWHNIGYYKGGKLNDKDWWNFLIQHNKIAASFSNEHGDKGDRILKSYIKGDKILAYKSGVGLIGYGVIENPKYKLIKKDSREDVLGGFYLHRLDCNWKAYSKNFKNAINVKELKEKYKIHHPLMTSSEIKKGEIDSLINYCMKNFDSSN